MQAISTVALTADEYLPAAHLVQELAPPKENFPAPQSSHAELAPPKENFPAPQSSHAWLPIVSLSLPAAHAVQVASWPRAYPASHSHISGPPLLPDGAMLPAGHTWQRVLPGAANMPAEHGVQEPGLTPAHAAFSSPALHEGHTEQAPALVPEHPALK